MCWSEVTKTLEDFNKTLHSLNKQFDELNKLLKRNTIFNEITSSPEELAKNLVYEVYVDDKWGTYYRSTIFDYDSKYANRDIGEWRTREEAIKETIKRLNEKCNI